MKKSFIGLFLASLLLVGCGGKTVLVDEASDYYVTGSFAGWGDATKPANEGKYLLTAVAVNDARVKPLKKLVKKATLLYVYENLELKADQEWTNEARINEGDAETVVVNGGTSIKVLQTGKGEEAPVFWAQNKESGPVQNLTPETLYLAPYQEGEKWDKSGDWASNPFALEAGNYTVVWAKLPGAEVATWAMGLIKLAA